MNIIINKMVKSEFQVKVMQWITLCLANFFRNAYKTLESKHYMCIKAILV